MGGHTIAGHAHGRHGAYTPWHGWLFPRDGRDFEDEEPVSHEQGHEEDAKEERDWQNQLLPMLKRALQPEADSDDDDGGPEAGIKQQVILSAIPADGGDAPDEHGDDAESEGFDLRAPDESGKGEREDEQPASAQPTTQSQCGPKRLIQDDLRAGAVRLRGCVSWSG